MGLEDIKRKFFGSEELTVEYSEAPEIYRERKLREIEIAESRAETLKERTQELLEELKKDLGEMREYTDDEGLKVVDDVAEDFAQSQKLTVEEAEFSDNIDQHLKDLEDFVSEFNDVSEKQGQVMRRINNRTELLSVLENINDHVTSIQDFLSTRYTAVKQYRRVAELEEEISGIEADIKDKEMEKDSISTEEQEEKKEDIETEIKELKDSDEWHNLQNKKQRVEELKDEKQEIRNKISKNISTMRRGLKKLIYQVQNDEIDFEAEVSKLDKVSEGEYAEAGNIQEELEEARKRIKQEELLEPRQIQNFVDASRELSDFEEMISERDRLKEEIEALEKEIKDIEVKEKVEGLERDLRDAKDKIQRKEEKKTTLEEEITRLKERKEEKIRELEDQMNEGLDAEVNLEEL